MKPFHPATQMIVRFFVITAVFGPLAALAQGPSYSCAKVEAGSVEEMICKDEALSALDRTLADVYANALKKSSDEQMLKAEQRGWLKGRNECWKSDDQTACVREHYQRRIAELQATYRLVPETGPFTFACSGGPGDELTVSFFQTDPPTLIAERGTSVSLMFQQPSASGTRYQGQNETFWEHQGEATVTWGFEAPEMKCSRQ